MNVGAGARLEVDRSVRAVVIVKDSFMRSWRKKNGQFLLLFRCGGGDD